MATGCQQVKIEYEQVKNLKQEFAVTYEQARQSGDYQEIKKLKIILENKKMKLDGKLGVIKGITPEGLEVKFKLDEQLEYWREFYQKKLYKKQGVDWAELPRSISLSAKQQNEIKRLIQELGFDTMLIIPEGLADTREKYEKLIKTMSNAPHDFVQLGFQDSASLPDLKNRSDKLRIIVTKNINNMKSDALFNQTRGPSIEDLENSFFREKKITGFDLAAYLILQREIGILEVNDYTWLPGTECHTTNEVLYIGYDPNPRAKHYILSSASPKERWPDFGCRLAGTFFPSFVK